MVRLILRCERSGCPFPCPSPFPFLSPSALRPFRFHNKERHPSNKPTIVLAGRQEPGGDREPVSRQVPLILIEKKFFPLSPFIAHSRLLYPIRCRFCHVMSPNVRPSLVPPPRCTTYHEISRSFNSMLYDSAMPVSHVARPTTLCDDASTIRRPGLDATSMDFDCTSSGTFTLPQTRDRPRQLYVMIKLVPHPLGCSPPSTT